MALPLWALGGYPVLVAGPQFVDGEPPAYWATKTKWAIDPANGDDRAPGWGASLGEAESHPLRTFNRLWDRMAGQRMRDVIVSLKGSPSFSEDFLAPPPSIGMIPTGSNRGGGIQIVGTATVRATGTVTGVRIYTDDSGKGKYIVAASGFAFTGYNTTGAQAYFIRKVGGGWCAPILTVETLHEISIGRPNGADPYAFFNPGGAADVVSGDPFEIVTFPMVGNFGATNCRVGLSQVFVNADGYRNLVSGSGGAEVQLKFCATLPKVYHSGNLYLSGCVLLDHFTVDHGKVGAVQNAILGNVAGGGGTNVQLNIFNGFAGLVDTTLQNGGGLDARNQGHIRCSGYTILHDFTADSTAPMVFGLDESGRMNFDPGATPVRGGNIAGHLFLAETPNHGGVWGLSSSTFNVGMVAPFDTNCIAWALEVANPQTFPYSRIASISTDPITRPLLGSGGFWDGYQ